MTANRPQPPYTARPTTRRTALRGALAALLLACGAEPPSPTTPDAEAAAASGRRPDVVVVSIDTLRADRLGAYGYDRPTSPTIDSLAERGVRFANAIAESSWTLPSHMTLMSGLHPSRHKTDQWGRRLADGTPTLAEVLRDAGYRTFAYTTGGFVGSAYGFARGFETYFEEFRNFDALIRIALERLDDLPEEEPYFLFIQTFDVHCPFVPRERYAKQFETRPPSDHLDTRKKCGNKHYSKMELREGQVQFLSDLYDAGIRQADDALGGLVQKIQDRGTLDQTIFVLLSDHGEELGDHGSFGHGRTLHREVLRVPIVLLAPGLPNAVVEQRVGLVDLMPTILDLLGLSAPPMQGRSLVPLIGRHTDAEQIDAASFSETSRMQAGLRSIETDRWKLVVDRNSGSKALYDLDTDPLERVDVSEREPAVAAGLLEQLVRHLAESAVPGPPMEAHPTPRNLEQLEALGYVEAE